MHPSERISEPSSSCVAGDNSLNESGHATPLPSKTINEVRSKQGARIKRERSELSPSKANSQGFTRKRFLASSSHNDAFNGEDSGNDKPHRGQIPSEKWLACPFFKHDPANYCKLRACQIPGWPSMGRVKEHIMRRHKADMTTSQIDCLQSRSRYSSKSDEERWIEMFNVLFPKAQKPPTPYCSDPSDEKIASINTEVPKLLHERLAKDSTFNGNGILIERIAEIVKGCMTSAMAKYQNPELIYAAPLNTDESFMPLELGCQTLPETLPQMPFEESVVNSSAVVVGQHLLPWLNESDFLEPQTVDMSFGFGWEGP